MIHNPSAIQWYTHVILDEVHERSIDTDFAMLVIRRLISTGQRTKIILMSATLQGDMLTKYFEETFHFSLISAPYFVGAKRYPIKQCFYEDLVDLADNCASSDKKSHLFLKNVSQKLRCTTWQDCMIQYPCVTDINMDVCTHLITSQSNQGESVLVFLPGIASISLYYDRLAQYINENGLEQRFKLFILHSQVPFEDQKEAFENPALDVVHVILATNIAESSVTLPKLRMVINFGIYHQLKYNPKRRTSCLKRRWCSRASCAQRAGRAGRVCDGIVVHLFSKKFHDNVLSAYDPPEILTAPLAKLILQVKMICRQLGESSPSRFLSDAIEFPSIEQLQVALRDLAELGAIASNSTDNNAEVDEEANITFLGYFCLALPVELSLCRLVLYGILLGIPFEGIVVAASLSLYQDVFSRPSSELLNPEIFLQRLKSSTTSRVTFDGGHYSHAVQICTLFKKWIEFRNANLCTVSGCSRFSMIRAFCMNVGVRWERLFQLESAVADIAGKVMAYIPEGHAVHTELLNLTKLTDHRKDFLVHRQKKRSAQYSEISLNYCEDVLLIKALMVCSFSNQLLIGKRAVNCSNPKKMKRAQLAVKVMSQCGMDPAQTMVMHNLQNPTIPSLQFLSLSILPERHCNVMVQSDTGFISLVPKLGSMSQTAQMQQQAAVKRERVLDADTQNSAWNPYMMEESVVQQKLSPDIVHLWQYGENKPLWKVSGLQDVFTRASHPYHVCWERLSHGGEVAYNTNWRQPVHNLVDLGQDGKTFLAVAATLQGSSHERVVSVSDISVLPNHDKGFCSSALLILAFQPHTASISFLFNKDYKICGMKIKNHPINFHSSQMLTLDDIVRINELRKAMSDFLSSSNACDGDIVFHMDKVSTIHSLLDIVLRRQPDNLVSQLPIPSPYDMVWEMVEFGFLDEELLSISDDDSDVPNSHESWPCNDFYPPMKLAILNKAVVKEILPSSFRTNYLFHSHLSQNSTSAQNVDFKLSPLAKSFVPQSYVSDKNSIGSTNVGTVHASLRMQSKKSSFDDERSGPSDSVSDEVHTGPQPKEMQLKIFQPHSATSAIARSSSLACQNSYDVSHLATFFPQGFSGFGNFAASYQGHFNPCVVLQANPSSRTINPRTHSSIIEFEVPTIGVWSATESLAQLRNKYNQCLLLFGETLMSKLRLRHVDDRSLLAITQGQGDDKAACLQVGEIQTIAEGDSVLDVDSYETSSACNDAAVSHIDSDSPTERFILGSTASSQQAPLTYQNNESDGAHVPRIFHPNSRSLVRHNTCAQLRPEIHRTRASGNFNIPQPCLRYNPPVYVPPPAFSAIQSQAQKRIPPVVRGPGKSKHKHNVKSRSPAQFMPAVYNARYQHPLWLSNMLCAPPKIHPSEVYSATEDAEEKADQVSYLKQSIKLTCKPNFIPPVGSIWNTEHAGTFVVHKPVSKKEKEKPPHLVYGIADDLLACFFYDYLKIVGKTPGATLCGPVYRQWLLNTCSVSLDTLSHLPFNFFENYPKKFSIFIEKESPMVQIAQDGSLSSLSCVKDSTDDDGGGGGVSLHNSRQALDDLDLNIISNSSMSHVVPSHLEDRVNSTIGRPLNSEHCTKQLDVLEVAVEEMNVAALPSEVAVISAATYSDHSNVFDLIIPPPPGFGPMNQSVTSKLYHPVEQTCDSEVEKEFCVSVSQTYDHNEEENSIPFYPLSQAPCESLSQDVIFGESTSLDLDSSSSPDAAKTKQEHCKIEEMSQLNDRVPLLASSVSSFNLSISGDPVVHGTEPVASDVTQPVHIEPCYPPPGLGLSETASGSIITKLHQALFEYGIDDAVKLESIMKTVEEMKVSSELVTNTPEVLSESMLSSDSSENDLVHEMKVDQCHFPSALLTPGSSSKSLTTPSSETFPSSSLTGESHEIDVCKKPKVSVFSESCDLMANVVPEKSVNNLVPHKIDDSSPDVVCSKPPLESKTGFEDPITASYLFSIVQQKIDLLPEEVVQSSSDHEKCGAIYCSSLEKSLPTNILDEDHSLSGLNCSILEVRQEIDSTLSTAIDQKEQKEVYCSERLEASVSDQEPQIEEIGGTDIRKGSLSSPSQVDRTDGVYDATVSKRLEGSEKWSTNEEDGHESLSVLDDFTESNSWPDLIKEESFSKSAISDQSSFNAEKNLSKVHSAPHLSSCDGDDEGGKNGDHCSSTRESDKSGDSWPGVEQELVVSKSVSDEIYPSSRTAALHDADLCQVGDVSSSEAWSVNPTNSEEDKSVVPGCHSPSVCLSVDNSSDWIEMPKEQCEGYYVRTNPSFSKAHHSNLFSSSSLPDQEWYVPPQRKTSQYTEEQSAALLECMARVLKDGPVTFHTVILHYRKEFPGYPYLCKDYFFSNPKYYICTISSRGVLTISLCGQSKASSSSVESVQQHASADTTTTYRSSQPSSTVQVTSPVDQDRKIVLKEVCKVINQNKKNRIRCSQIRRRISFGLRPNERLDRLFFERHSSLFDIEEIRYKSEGDEKDFFVSLVKHKLGSSRQESARSRKLKANKTRSRSQSCRGQREEILDESEVPTSHEEATFRSKPSEGKQGGEERRKRKKKKNKAEISFPERFLHKTDQRRYAMKGRGSHRGEPLYVYGSGLPFYCSKAESEGEV